MPMTRTCLPAQMYYPMMGPAALRFLTSLLPSTALPPTVMSPIQAVWTPVRCLHLTYHVPASIFLRLLAQVA